jgi:tRNA A37 threonylcarbamoyladenosine synthetase subunit TsaC/SUA5/YrdC
VNLTKLCFLKVPHCSSTEAVNRIYEIKGCNLTSPLAICVADVADIPRFARTDHLPIGLFDQLLPGPITVVLKRGLPSFVLQIMMIS